MLLDFQQKRRIKDFFYSKPFLMILILILIFSLVSTFKVFKKMSLSRSEMKKSEERLIELEAKRTDLLAKISNIQTEEGLEREIRDKFSVAREDEKVVVIVPDEEVEPVFIEYKKTIWQKIKDFLNF